MNKTLLKRIFSVFISLIILISACSVGLNVSAESNIDVSEYSFPLLGKTVNVTSPYAAIRIINGKQNFHKGIDFAANEGDAVMAWKSGTVVDVHSSCSSSHISGSCRCGNTFGNHVTIFHGKHKNRSIFTVYAHLSKVNVSVNQQVKQGMTIGRSGNTGNSTGAHLHFGLFLDNYYGNHVDPTPYLGIKNKKGTHKVTHASLVESMPTIPDVKLTPISNSKIKLSYKSGVAESYVVERKIDKNEWKTISNKTKKTEYTHDNLPIGKTYSFRVKAFSNGEYSKYSEVVSFTGLAKAKLTYANFAKISSNDTYKSNNAVLVKWNNVKGAKEYELFRKKNDNSSVKIATINKTYYKDDRLSNNKKYKYFVRAINGKAKGEYSNGMTLETMPLPKISSLKANSNTSVTININKIKDVDKYIVYSKLSTADKYSTLKTSKEPKINITGLKSGKKHYFKVIAVKNNVATDTSKVKSFQSIARGNITECLLTNNNKVSLKWDKIPGATMYYVQFSNKTEQTSSLQKTTSTSMTFIDLVPGNKYSFMVKGVRGNISGSFSQEKTAKPLSAPEIKNYGLKTANSAFIEWNKVSGAKEYKLYRKKGEASYALIKTLTKNETSYIDKKLAKNTIYKYFVVAINGKNKSEKSEIVSVKRLAGSPTLTITKRSDTGVSLSWSKIDGVRGYILYRKVNNGSFAKLASFTSQTSTYRDANVEPGNSYFYIVKGYSGSIYTPYSNEVDFKILGKTEINSAIFSDITTVKINWNKNNGADGYVLQVSLDDDGWEEIYKGENNSFTMTNTSIASEHKFRVRGYYVFENKYYYSEFSTIVTAKYDDKITVPQPSIELVSGDTWIEIKITETEDSDFYYQYAYSTTKDGKYTTSDFEFDPEYLISNLKSDEIYYLKARIILPVGRDKNGDEKYMYGRYTSPKQISTHSRYDYVGFTELIDLGNLFNVTPIISPTPPGPYSDGSDIYMYSASELKNKASNYITKYKNAITESGGSYSEKTKNNSKLVTININNNKYYLAYNSDMVVISNLEDSVLSLI